jgi:hypothetical protein
MNNKLKLFLLFFLICIVSGLGFLLLKQKTATTTIIGGKSHKIVLTEKGFEPENITINQGDSIVFSTTRTKDFWPASNLHPTHEIYPEFDPKEPITPNKTWSFQFNKVGSWKFHDHLFPFYTGTIIVKAQSGRIVTPSFDAQSCSTFTAGQQQQCWDSIITKTLEEKGLDKTFALFDQLYNQNPNFASNCHDFTHTLGKKTYALFARHEQFAISPKSSYCGYGFYHGFMEALIHAGADIKIARDFCDSVDKTLSDKIRGAGSACLHGIGHGLVEDVPDTRKWGNAQVIIRDGLDTCDKISKTKLDIFICTSGVFNALELLMSNNKANLTINKNDPMWICPLQKDDYKKACYTQLLVTVLNSTKRNIQDSMRFVDKIKEDDYAIPTMESLAVELVRLHPQDYQQNLDFCRSIAPRFYNICISSYAEGYIKYGAPQKETEGALAFCNSSLLNTEEKKICFGKIESMLRLVYSVNKSLATCDVIPQEYRSYSCSKEAIVDANRLIQY